MFTTYIHKNQTFNTPPRILEGQFNKKPFALYGNLCVFYKTFTQTNGLSRCRAKFELILCVGV
jgi:hypothetical protein